jgi:hypothetical protein
VRAPDHQVRVLKRVDHRGHVPGADAQLHAQFTHDGWAPAVQRFEEPQPGVGEAAAGAPVSPPEEGRREAGGLRHQGPPTFRFAQALDRVRIGALAAFLGHLLRRRIQFHQFRVLGWFS